MGKVTSKNATAYHEAGHAVGGAQEYSKQQLEHGGHAVTTLTYLGTSQFWFESLQNW